MTTTILETIDWISNRLLYKYKEKQESEIFTKIGLVKSYILSKNNHKISLTKNQLDDILSKYYADFYLDGSDDLKIGYTEKQRDDIRSSVLCMAQDILDCSDNEKSNNVHS